MIFNKTSPAEKRKILRKKLHSPSSCLRFVGSFSPLSSLLIEKKGFEGLYISGGAFSAGKGLPDIGLNSWSEVVEEAQNISQVSQLPSIMDADTGFGGAIHCAHTVHQCENQGLTGLHIEDQSLPKRCGHLDKKSLIPTKDMVLKIQAGVKARKDKNFLIIARTDARGVEGIDSALERAKAYREAGADMIFPEALHSVKEFELFRSKISAPLLANMTEFGKTDIIPFQTFKSMGFNMIIYPMSLLRLTLKALDEGLNTLLADEQKSLLKKMQSRQELYDLLNYSKYNQWDRDIFNFSLK